MRTVHLIGLLWLYLGYYVASSDPSSFLDFDNLPDTNFSCVGKVIGGYYADLETNCQMFHVCTIGQLDEPMDIRFLCLNGTVFDQETRVCERIDEVDCTKSEQFYSLNLELYGNNQASLQDETEPPIIIKATTTTSTSTTTTTTTTKPTTKVPPPKIQSHHFPISEASDIRFNPEEINISLNPRASPNIRPKTVTYQKQIFNDNISNNNNNKVVVTTHTSYGTTPELLKLLSNTQRPIIKPTEINYGFTSNYQYHHTVPYGQYRNQFKTSTRPTLPPLTFSSPAPFSLDQHIEAKRYASDPSPRIIISASASVSDNSGRRLNYSLGTIGVTPLLEEPPKDDDDYKDPDVILDPFYHDVPKLKLKKSRRKRQTDETALEVLKFLFDWYRKHQKTSTTVAVPFDITEINRELAPVKRSRAIQITGDVISATESPVTFKKDSGTIQTTGDVTSMTQTPVTFTTESTTDDLVDYVDDNYEAYTEQTTTEKEVEDTTTEMSTTTTESIDENTIATELVTEATIEPTPTSSYQFKPQHRFASNFVTTTAASFDVSDSEEMPPTVAPLLKSANPPTSLEPLETTPMYKVQLQRQTFIFNCFGKTVNEFYADPRDCRLFHYCTSGYSKNQLLDLKFVCDMGTYFDDEKLICTKRKPLRCL